MPPLRPGSLRRVSVSQQSEFTQLGRLGLPFPAFDLYEPTSFLSRPFDSLFVYTTLHLGKLPLWKKFAGNDPKSYPFQNIFIDQSLICN